MFEFLKKVFRLPAQIFNSIVELIFGSKKENKTVSGIAGLILDGCKAVLDFVKAIGTTITGFFMNNEKTIARAFWASLLVAGAAALTVGLWPAALAAVASFSVAGYSIASLVGTGFAAQVAATAAVAATLTSASVYTLAAVSSFVGFITSCFTKKATHAANEADILNDEELFNIPGSSTSLANLGGSALQAQASKDAAPVYASLAQAKTYAAVTEEQSYSNNRGYTA